MEKHVVNYNPVIMVVVHYVRIFISLFVLYFENQMELTFFF